MPIKNVPNNKPKTLTFGNHVIDDTHASAELKEFAQMSGQLVEACHHGQLLACVSLVKGNLNGA